MPADRQPGTVAEHRLGRLLEAPGRTRCLVDLLLVPAPSMKEHCSRRRAVARRYTGDAEKALWEEARKTQLSLPLRVHSANGVKTLAPFCQHRQPYLAR